MKIMENQLKSMKINEKHENQRKSKKIYENHENQ